MSKPIFPIKLDSRNVELERAYKGKDVVMLRFSVVGDFNVFMIVPSPGMWLEVGSMINLKALDGVWWMYEVVSIQSSFGLHDLGGVIHVQRECLIKVMPC